MCKKIRLLFSIETADKWIIDAYKAFYDLLNRSGQYEIFCTVCNGDLSDELIDKYNFVDYKKISKNSINSLVENLSGNPSGELIKQSEKMSLWETPQRLLERFFRFKRVYSLLQPDLVIVWNGMADIRGLIATFLSQIREPFFYAEKGMLPDSWYLDESGINAECSLDGSSFKHDISSQEQQKTQTYIQSIVESGSSAWDQPARISSKETFRESLGIENDLNIIFFPGQVDEDVNVTRFSTYANVAEAIKQVLDSMPQNSVLVVKPHPKSKEASKHRLADLSNRYKNLRVVNNVNVWDVIESSDLIVSINSTVAFESMLKGRQVLLLGDSVLSKTGLLEKVKPAELSMKINESFTRSSDHTDSCKKVFPFVCFLREEFYIFRNSQSLPEPIVSRIEKRVPVVSGKVFSREELIRLLFHDNVETSSFCDSTKSAVDYFLNAQKEHEKNNFNAAILNIEKYQSQMHYSKLSRIVKSERSDIDISVVIVTYQRKDDLCKCLETVSNQDMGNYEIIIVDNGGCDYNAIERYIDQYIKCPVNFNLSEGRNIGVHFASGKIVVFLDDDALVGNKYLSSIESAFEQYDIVGLRGKTLPKNNPAVIQRPNIFDLGDRAFPTYCNQEGNSAWLRDAYLYAGGMDPLLFGHEGSDLTYRVIQKYKNPAKVIYWPDAVIYHDYPTPQKSMLKRQVHQRNECYLKYKHNADIFFNRGAIEKYQVLRKTGVSQLTNSCEPAKNIDGSSPKISIIISCYNCQKYLPACLESIEAQSLQEWELFLIDDSSTDNTKMLIEKFSQKDKRIRPYYFQDNKGPYVRRNFAIERANSDYIVIHDSDDIMHPNKLARLYEEIAKDEELTVVGSFYLTALDEFRGFDYADKIELPVNHNQIMENYKTQLYICWHGSAVIRRSMFETIGLYDENPYGSDKFWLAKAGEYARYTGRKCFKNIPEYLTYKIEHASSQQGTLTTLDPRSRRAGFQTYWLYKLMKIREKAFSNASINVAEELKNCKCGDYIERYGHLFHNWESKPLSYAVLCGFIERAVLQFNEKRYVSCIITLDSVEKIETNVTKRYHNYDFLRGMAYFAIGEKEKCLKFVNNEISNHNNEVVKRFYDECVSSQVIKKVDKWCQENRGRYNPRIVEAAVITETKPLVSVIMPAYNAAEYIAQAIDSVLRQDYRNFELIIINDGSTDDTGKIIEGFRDDRIKYFSQENRGPAATCNIGIKKSAGEYIVRLDSDDMITPDFLGRHIEEFEKNPHADLVYCDDCLIEQQGRIIRVIERPEYSEQKYLIRDLFRNGFPVVPFRTCIKKNVFDKIGFFDEELCVAEDYDMIRRFVMHDLKNQHLKGALYLRRLTSGSLSRDFSIKKAESHFDVVERFAGTFDYEDLFPDIDWHKIPSQKRRFKAECLIAETFLAIGKSYLDTNTSPLYAQTAFAKARKHLSIALEIDPNNHQIRQLLNKYGTCHPVPAKRTAGHESPVAC
jgi:glycosyltransferase involved in cell wall biosynthesis